MTSEEIQRTMEFILQQQAQSSVRIDGLAGKVDALADVQNRAEERWTRTEESIRALLSIAEIRERQIDKLGEQITAVNEAGRATDDRLNALINIVERQISEGRNGNS